MKITQLYRKTMRCRNIECLACIRVGRPLYEPATRIGVLAYCPMCGGKASAEPDEEENYMEVLAEAHEISVDVLKAIMHVWNREMYPKLYDFIAEIKRQATEEKVAV